MDFNELSREFMDKARACRSVEDLVELCKDFGVELSDNELKAISGGEQCIKDTGCMIYDVINRCPTKASCPTLFDCIIESCTDLQPIECTELFQCEDNFPCGILKH